MIKSPPPWCISPTILKSISPYHDKIIRLAIWGELGWQYQGKALSGGGMGWIELHYKYAHLILLLISFSILRRHNCQYHWQHCRLISILPSSSPMFLAMLLPMLLSPMLPMSVWMSSGMGVHKTHWSYMCKTRLGSSCGCRLEVFL